VVFMKTIEERDRWGERSEERDEFWKCLGVFEKYIENVCRGFEEYEQRWKCKVVDVS
jgi:hypothetical protein